MAKVNFEFIAELEGGPALRGYVPDPAHSNSGVTIATGFDIGQRSVTDLIKLLGSGSALVNLLQPYCELTKYAAVRLLQRRPLAITAEQAVEIDLCVKQQLLQQLEKRFNSTAKTSFEDLPEAVRTVIASVAFQYGDLSQRCPKFWGAATRSDYGSMVNELRNFGDRYPTRRKKEADYLARGTL